MGRRQTRQHSSLSHPPPSIFLYTASSIPATKPYPTQLWAPFQWVITWKAPSDTSQLRTWGVLLPTASLTSSIFESSFKYVISCIVSFVLYSILTYFVLVTRHLDATLLDDQPQFATETHIAIPPTLASLIVSLCLYLFLFFFFFFFFFDIVIR